MSIRVRLLLSYIAMLIVPIILSILAAIIIVIAFLGDIKTAYHAYTDPKHSIYEPLQKEAALSDQLKMSLTGNPDSILSTKTAEQWDHQYNEFNTGIIVTKNNQIIYLSPFIHFPINKNDWNQAVVTKGNSIESLVKQENTNGIFRLGNNSYIYKHIDFRFKDKSNGSVFLVKEQTPIGEFVRKFILVLLLSLIGI